MAPMGNQVITTTDNCLGGFIPSRTIQYRIRNGFGALRCSFFIAADKCCVKQLLICVKHFQEVLLLLDGLIAGVTLRVKQPA
jgi:hypothetical protein